MRFDENLAAVHAYLCGDGYAIRNPETQKSKYYMIGFRNINITLLKDFQKRFAMVFGMKPYITNEGRCRIGSKEVYEKLTESFGSFYSYHWKAPELSEEFSKIWLRAFFDCEGWVFCKSHQNRCIGLDSVNKMGLFQIEKMLKDIGITCRVKKRNTRNIFSLAIYGRENLIKFRDEINFLHPSKKEKLNMAIKDFINYCWEFPLEKGELKEFVVSILKKKMKIKKGNFVARLISSKEENLIRLHGELRSLFSVESRVGKRKNGIGTVYYELSVNKKAEVRKLVKYDLMSEVEKKKWLSSKKSIM
jgi:hypothetical protein